MLPKIDAHIGYSELFFSATHSRTNHDSPATVAMLSATPATPAAPSPFYSVQRPVSGPHHHGPTPMDFNLPPDAISLPPPTRMHPPMFSDRRDDVTDNVGTRNVRTYGVHLPPALTATPRPPVYTAMAIRGANNKMYEGHVMYDSGSDRTFLTPSMATMLGLTVSTDKTKLNYANSGNHSVSHWTADGITIWHGLNYSCHIDRLGILDMPVDVVPYMLLGRDIAEQIGITISGLQHRFPRELLGDEHVDFQDLNDRQSNRVYDDEDIPADVAARRDPIRQRLQSQVDNLKQHLPVNGFIDHPRATVQILHRPGTPPAYRKQYGGKHKSLLDSYITAQVLLWLENGKLVEWDEDKHGYSPTYNMPLLPIVTRDPSGQIKKVRVCVDARHINVGIINDDTPLPNISRLFSDLATNKWFSEFDMESAFNQFPVDVASQHKLAINWEGKTYCFAGAPFGIKHISSHVQRVLGEIFADMPYVRIYVDNLIVASPDLDAHEEHCRLFIERCLKYKILLSPNKCKLCFTKLKTLGNVVTGDGVRADPEKVATVQRWELPQTPKELTSFLSFANYLRGYVRHYADMAAPLDAMRNRKQLHWTPILEQHFQQLKDAIAHAPALNFPDYDLPFALAVDSSVTGIGAVLFQPRNSGDYPDVNNIVAFCSRSLKTYERRYSVYKLELNALVYGLQQYEDILFGRKFTVLTDHQSLTYLHTQRDLHRTLRNWYATVCEFDFDIIHIPGHLNILPDTLSRMYEREWGLTTNAPSIARPPVAADVFILTQHSPDAATDANSYDVGCEIGGNIFHIDAEPLATHTPAMRAPVTDAEKRQLVEHAHNAGHFGSRAVHAALRRDGYSWMGMSKTINDVCSSCRQCQSWNQSNKIFHPTRSPKAMLPWDQIHLDLITSFADKPSTDGSKYILVITDVFTSFCLLEALPDKEATTVAAALWKAIGIFGPPKEIRSDNGTEFTAEVIRSLVANVAVGATQKYITAYNPHQSGKVESHVKIASLTLHKFLDEHVSPAWHAQLPLVQLFINAKHRNLTNTSPFALMFNRAHNAFQYYTSLDVENLSPLSFDDWLARQEHLHKVIFPVVSDRVHALQQKYHSKYALKRLTSSRTLPTGTMVMIKDVTRNDKMEPPFVGPYMVVRSNPTGAYTLKDTAGGLFHRDVTRHQLKVITSDAFAKDFSQAEYVSRITGHSVIDGRVHYETWFSGYNAPEMVPEENIDDKNLIRDYLATKKIIPASLNNLQPIDRATDPMLSAHASSITSPKKKKAAARAIQSSLTDATSVPSPPASATTSSTSQPPVVIPDNRLSRHHRSRRPTDKVVDNSLFVAEAHQTCPFFPNVQDLF